MRKSFIHHPRSLKVRRAIFLVHLWTGVLVGLYLLAISVSGSILVFQRELLNDSPATSFSASDKANDFSYGKIVEQLQQQDPTLELQSIDMRSRQRQLVTLTFTARGREQVFYVDRKDGTVLVREDLKSRHPVMSWMESLHNELLSGSRGATANGIGGLLLVALCATGIVIWWPGLRVWTRAFTVKWQAGWRRINFDLHSAVGFWTLLFVLMWGATGAYFIFPKLIQQPLHLFSIPAGAKTSQWVKGDRIRPIDEYISAASRQYPGESLAYVYMDVNRPGGQVSVFFSTDPSVPLTLRENIVYLNPANSEVLWTESSKHWSPVERVLMAAYAFHFGDFGGLTSKVIWCVLGMSLSLLTVTGYLMWWNRVLRRSWPFRRSTKVRTVAVESHAP